MRVSRPLFRAAHHALRRVALAGPCALVLTSGCLKEPTSGPDDPVPVNRTETVPTGWTQVGTLGADELGRPYSVGVDQSSARTGSSAAFITSRRSLDVTSFGGLGQSVTAIPYRGLRVRWSIWLRPTQVSGYAGAWLRVDGAGRTLAFDNMSTRGLSGTSDWTYVSVVVDVPDNAAVMVLGMLLTGPGDLLADDGKFEIVDTSVPVTDRLVDVPLEEKPVVQASVIPGAVVPTNADFEGPATSTGSERSINWLRTAAVPFRTAEPGGDDTDLAPLGAMLGTARLVGLGEATHGTREFFQLKHRVFEYLVRNKGFTHFAIEGSWAEANEIDHYVRTGEGDARRVLSRLGFWTWNTEEVLALIEWMRAYNTTAAPAAQVRFLGFDMQFASLPADTVEAFVAREMPTQVDSVGAWLACLRPFRRIDGVEPRPLVEYAGLPTAERTACRNNLAKIADALEGYTGSAPAANAQQSARVLQQWERVAGAPSTSSRIVERDLAMADNVSWLRSQAPTNTGMMLWAHNGHVAMRQPWMGRYLRDRYSDDYRAVALLFRTGSFTAQALPIGTGLRSFQASVVPSASMEWALGLAGGSHLMFDARQLTAPGVTDGLAFRGPLSMRSIGSAFNPSAELSNFAVQMLPDDFDHVLYMRETTASRTLPFVH